MSILLKNNKALKKKNEMKGFNMVSEQPSHPITFDPQPLCLEEVSEIKNLLLESEGFGEVKVDKIERDSVSLAQLTSELKGIGRQGVFLMGERVSRAKEILKSYRDGTFTRWLSKTFGTRKTGYNALSYYELCRELPDKSSRERFMKMPLSAAYILASREGELAKKISLINEYSGWKQHDILEKIRNEFPTDQKGGRKEKTSIESLIHLISLSLRKLEKKKQGLSKENRKCLLEVKKVVSEILLV